MEREASLLSCSKLSCYAEFNRMVQAIARSGGGGRITAFPAIRSMHGTSAEYCFYTTLVMMLKQIISNPDPAAQQWELQRVYQWFSVNKPLMTTKTKPGHRKPMLSLTSPRKTTPAGGLTDWERPQTAPACLYKPNPPPMLPLSHHPRPHNSAADPPQHSFTSSFMSQSLGREMERVGVGMPFEQLRQLRVETDNGEEAPTLHNASRIGGSNHSRMSKRETRLHSSGGGGRKRSPVAIFNIPTPDSLSGHVSSHAHPHGVSFGAVFAMAPNIAAKMTLSREMRKAQETASRQSMFQPGSHDNCPPPSRQSLTTPTEKPLSSCIVDSGQAKDPSATLGDKVPNPNTSNPNHKKTHTSMNEAHSSKTEKTAGMELKPDDVGMGNISVSVVHMDSSITREHDTEATEERDAVSCRSTEDDEVKLNLIETQKRTVSAGPAKQGGHLNSNHGDYTFLTTTLDPGFQNDADKEPETTEAANLATELTNDTKDSGLPTNTQHSLLVTESGVKNYSSPGIHEHCQDPLQRAQSENTGDPTLGFRIIDVSHTNTAQPSANLCGKKAPKRMSTPMNTITIAFPSTLEQSRPRTCFGERTRKRPTQMSAAGFKKNRYRPRTVAASASTGNRTVTHFASEMKL